MRKVALLTVFAFGCTTIRVPVSSLGGELGAIRGAIAEPQLELWIESADPVPPAEAAKAEGAARAALAQALEGRGVPEASADAVLLVRERAVARTDSRRRSQGWATVGIVVGVVVVVAAVVIAIVTGSKGSPKTVPRPASPPAPAPPRSAAAAPARAGSAPGARSAPARTPAVRPAPQRAAVGPVPAPPRVAPLPAPRPAPVPAPRYAPYYAPYYGPHDGFDVAIGLELVFPLPPPEPLVLAPPQVPGYAETPDAGAFAPGSGAVDDEEAPDEEPLPPPALLLPPPQPFDVEQRGFFAGDVVQLELVLLDQRTGRTLWSKVVRRDVDPRDAREIAAVVQEALADQAWAQRPRAAGPGHAR
jgi:hypothetical protein